MRSGEVSTKSGTNPHAGEPTFPGCRICGRVVGVFHMTDEKGPDEKIILVPLRDPAWMRIHDVHDIPPEFRDEIEHFFQFYKDMEEKKTETRGPACRHRECEWPLSLGARR